jgi:hypothetical protein
MTARELIQVAGQHWLVLLAVFLLPPLATWLCGRAHGAGNGGNAPWKYAYSALVYLTSVPGTFAAVLTGYTLFFTRENLLDVNPLVYFLPIGSMVVTLIFIRKSVSFALIPGFDRLEGLLALIACSFVLALAIQKTRIWIVFGGSIERLFILAAAIFALLKWGAYTLFRGRSEPKKEPPEFPGMGSS